MYPGREFKLKLYLKNRIPCLIGIREKNRKRNIIGLLSGSTRVAEKVPCEAGKKEPRIKWKRRLTRRGGKKKS